MVYLDNAATTFPKPEQVYVAMDDMNRNGAVNAGRGSYKLARKASEIITDTKDRLRKLMQINIETPVVFAPSITIAINQIINGIGIKEGDTVYVSPYEHNAVARVLQKISDEKKIFIKELVINEETLEIDIEKTAYEFTKDKPNYVFCTHISNVTGYILPVEDIFREAKKYDCVTILDTAQSLGLIEVKPYLLHADFVAFAGHKSLYGPIGIGGFINVSEIEMDEYIVGGTGSNSLSLHMPQGMETKFESASQNITAIAGLNAALKVLNQKEIFESENEMTKYLMKRLKEISGIKTIEMEENQQIGIVSFVSDVYNSEDIGLILDEDFDIAVRTGYHCAPYIHKYLKDEGTLGTVRVGIGQFTTKEEIDSLIKALSEL